MASNPATIARWSERSGRVISSSNVSFNGPTLFSYGTPIAQFHDAPECPAVLFDCAKYSQSTSAVQNAARGAVRALTIAHVTFDVPDVSGSDHAGNHAHFLKLAEEAHAMALKPRTTTEYYERLAFDHLRSADRYSRVFGLGMPPAELSA